MQALGLIETRGALPAIEAADAMLKAAEVRLLEKTKVGGGLITIVVTGDVAAVKAAVDAGAAAVERIGEGCLYAQHVIARPHDELEGMVGQNKPPDPDRALEPEEEEEELPEPAERIEHADEIMEESPESLALPETSESQISSENLEKTENQIPLVNPENQASQESLNDPAGDPETEEFALSAILPHRETLDQLIESQGIKAAMAELDKLKVTELRTLAREYPELAIAGREISKANKHKLLEEFRNYGRKKNEERS